MVHALLITVAVPGSRFRVVDRVVGHDDGRVRIPDQDALAWTLVDELRPHLDRVTIDRVAMLLVDREYPTAIETLLGVAASAGAVLPDVLRERLSSWAAFYPASPPDPPIPAPPERT